mmetsp:Transcript_112087/g.317447  ORF Transcript_112087/g.317447 Transcript_112087/m.317447 type:complete len:230 (-) Transcript_112087:897-1586(-)
MPVSGKKPCERAKQRACPSSLKHVAPPSRGRPASGAARRASPAAPERDGGACPGVPKRVRPPSQGRSAAGGAPGASLWRRRSEIMARPTWPPSSSSALPASSALTQRPSLEHLDSTRSSLSSSVSGALALGGSGHRGGPSASTAPFRSTLVSGAPALSSSPTWSSVIHRSSMLASLPFLPLFAASVSPEALLAAGVGSVQAWQQQTKLKFCFKYRRRAGLAKSHQGLVI